MKTIVSKVIKDFKIISEYLKQIPLLNYKLVSDLIWNSILDEGLPEESDLPENKDLWKYSELKISEEDKLGLKNFNEDTIEKFNSFDIKLKDKYFNKYVDFIDYNKGKVYIIKYPKNQ